MFKDASIGMSRGLPSVYSYVPFGSFPLVCWPRGHRSGGYWSGGHGTVPGSSFGVEKRVFVWHSPGEGGGSLGPQVGAGRKICKEKQKKKDQSREKKKKKGKKTANKMAGEK